MTSSAPQPQPPVRLDDLIGHVLDRHPDGNALDHLSDAVQVSSSLGELADHLIGHFVDQARRSGASWTEIGEYMGVSKQAAQKRFVARDSDPDAPGLGRIQPVHPAGPKRGSRRTHAGARTRAGRSRPRAPTARADQRPGRLWPPEAIVELGSPLDHVRDRVIAALKPGRKHNLRRVAFEPQRQEDPRIGAARGGRRSGTTTSAPSICCLDSCATKSDRTARLLARLTLGVTHVRALSDKAHRGTRSNPGVAAGLDPVGGAILPVVATQQLPVPIAGPSG